MLMVTKHVVASSATSEFLVVHSFSSRWFKSSTWAADHDVRSAWSCMQSMYFTSFLKYANLDFA